MADGVVEGSAHVGEVKGKLVGVAAWSGGGGGGIGDLVGGFVVWESDVGGDVLHGHRSAPGGK